MSSPEGKVVIASGWRKSGILDAVEMGLSKLPVLDPFNDICPLVDASLPKETLIMLLLCLFMLIMLFTFFSFLVNCFYI